MRDDKTDSDVLMQGDMEQLQGGMDGVVSGTETMQFMPVAFLVVAMVAFMGFIKLCVR